MNGSEQTGSARERKKVIVLATGGTIAGVGEAGKTARSARNVLGKVSV